MTQPSRPSAGVAVLAAVAGRWRSLAGARRGEQAEQFTPEFREVRIGFDAKHTPKIAAPDTVKRGEWFEVTVSVGAGGSIPSLSEHFVRYIALYKDTAEIARVYLHPVFSSPKVTFTIALDEGGSLRAARRADPLGGLGGLEEDQRRALARDAARSSSRRSPPCAPTVTLAGTCPGARARSAACTGPAAGCRSANCPSAPVTA